MAEGDTTPEPYELRGAVVIDQWRKAHRPPDREYQRVRFFIRSLMVDPDRIPSMVTHHIGLPEHSFVVLDTDTQVTWVVLKSPPYARNLRSVMLTDIRPAPE